MIDPAILAAVPAALQTEYSAGAIYRVGMLLFRQGQPGIVAHLIETGGTANQLASVATNFTPLGAANMVANAVGHVNTNRKLNGILDQLGTLQSLQLANLALGGASLGMSIMSYKLISARLDTIEGRVEGLGEKLDLVINKIDDLNQRLVRNDLNDMRTFCERAEEGWEAGDPEIKWREAAHGLHGLQNRFSDELGKLVSHGSSVEVMLPFVDAFSLSATTRVACTMALGDIELAQRQAEDFSREFRLRLEPVGTSKLVQLELAARKIHPQDAKFAMEARELEPRVRAAVASIRDREDCTASLPLTVGRVRELGLDGREFLESARNETSESLLMLEGASGEGLEVPEPAGKRAQTT